jgi:hypothetical protein
MTMSKYYTIEEAAKLSGKSTRTIRRHIDKLDDTVKVNVTKKNKNKLFVSAEFVTTLTDVTENVKVNVTDVIVKNTDDNDLKRQILRLEKQLDEKDSQLKQMTEKHLDDIKIFTSKVLYLEDGKSKLSADAKAELEKANTEKKDLLIQKVRLEERLAGEQSKSKTAYLITGLLIAFLLIVLLLISLQVF